jgi:hypothetical protein
MRICLTRKLPKTESASVYLAFQAAMSAVAGILGVIKQLSGEHHKQLFHVAPKKSVMYRYRIGVVRRVE